MQEMTMKNVCLFLLLLLPSLAIADADDVAIERYIATRIALLQAQVDKLYESIFIMGNEDLAQEDLFTRIGQPSFQAVDEVLRENGYSHSQFYQFADQHQAAIDDWLKNHQASANQLDELTTLRDSLMQDYDQLVKSARPIDAGRK
jgi:hypothetical protein